MELRMRIRKIYQTMDKAIERGVKTMGVLPGGLKLPRRAPRIYRRLAEMFRENTQDALFLST